MSPKTSPLLPIFLVLSLVLCGGAELSMQTEIRDLAAGLESIAAEAAAGIDGDEHASIHSPGDYTSPAFADIRGHLRAAHDRHDLASPVYTLRRIDEGMTEFVVMTNPTPFIGDTYPLQEPMLAVYEGGDRTRTGLYGDEHGTWISGYAAVRRGDGRVEALVSVDRPSRDIHARLWRGRLGGLLAAGVLTGLLAGMLAVVRRRAGRLADLWVAITGHLSIRIGLAAAVPVILAVAVIALLQYRQGVQEIGGTTQERLQQIVRVAAPRVDPGLHAEVVETGNTASPAFLALREQLRSIHEEAALSSTLYTLRRDGEGTRFVAMNSEVPFLGDPYELRPELRETFADGRARAIGPYTDSHGTWVSAWAPIPHPDGTGVAAVLQADARVGALMDEVMNDALRDLVFALIALILAFATAAGLARSIADPVRRIAEATERVEQGDFGVAVPERGATEVARLAEAVNRMARGLQERERLRDVFGKYMAPAVAAELLARDEIRLAGELREVTVLISDIRGYTALTQELGATEVVALLNDYFGILVDAVIEQEGVIDKFMGDAVLAWFGAPVPQENHPSRAITAARAMLDRTNAWNAQRMARGLKPVETGIGIATGRVVVGNIGSVRRFEYTAIGEAVNLASRLCGRAEAGEIVAGEGVYAAAPAANWEDMGALEVKGVAQPVRAYRISVPGPRQGQDQGHST